VKQRITRKWVAAYLENVVRVERMRAEIIVAASEGRLDRDALLLLADSACQKAGLERAIGE
jgi:hypothetical protein